MGGDYFLFLYLLHKAVLTRTGLIFESLMCSKCVSSVADAA
jgi:hypothetical protein